MQNEFFRAGAPDLLCPTLAACGGDSGSLVSVRLIIAKIDDQAFLTAGHCQIDFGKNLGIEQGTM
ncbi:MAG: hypothetical protein CAPSK01_001199 [Candidatus Accumulibacter vicinus]|uniref:Uncharacterized protein n=1 Tax=Candidatus Accumulibacter vicinus TaxID=2954382 RepID=A0A084Y2R5_9PROT|nr:MAG: hypothetical protein CAPSK01_001199 [Candidatus Accumulibacter vicinus]